MDVSSIGLGGLGRYEVCIDNKYDKSGNAMYKGDVKFVGLTTECGTITVAPTPAPDISFVVPRSCKDNTDTVSFSYCLSIS